MFIATSFRVLGGRLAPEAPHPNPERPDPRRALGPQVPRGEEGVREGVPGSS